MTSHFLKIITFAELLFQIFYSFLYPHFVSRNSACFSLSEGYTAVLLNFELGHTMMMWVQTTLYSFPFF